MIKDLLRYFPIEIHAPEIKMAFSVAISTKCFHSAQVEVIFY